MSVLAKIPTLWFVTQFWTVFLVDLWIQKSVTISRGVSHTWQPEQVQIDQAKKGYFFT